MTTPMNEITDAVEEVLAARQKRAEALHDQIFLARENIRKHLKPDSPVWLREAFNTLHASLYILGGDPFDMHMRAALTAFLSARGEQGPTWPVGTRFHIEHDGFTGTVIGHYTRLDGKRGVVGQQDGTNVVHVYGEKWLWPALAPKGGA